MDKQCTQCSKTFRIDDRDVTFYKKITVPEPTLCPDCRAQRRQAWCNEMTLYPGVCGLCNKNILTIYAPKSNYVYYCRSCWWSDSWDPLDYGQTIDFFKPILPQLATLDKTVPHQATSVSGRTENCDYVHYCGDSKNCYLTFHADLNENCMYGYGIKNSKDCLDGYNNFECELCYQCTDCHNCNNLQWSQDCVSCYDSIMLKDCVGCRDCFGCVGLRNQQYCWLNEQLTEIEYKKRLTAINFGSREQVEYWLKQVNAFQETKFYKYAQENKNEDCTGNNLYQCKNTQASFDCREVENSKFCYQLSLKVKDSYDYYQYGFNSELIYESTIVGGNCYSIKFCHSVFDNCSNLEYCISCISTKDCFASVGLRQQQFCILNKQYSEEEYRILLTKIKQHMTTTGEYGEYFPSAMSQFGYNETSAQWWYPLDEKTAVTQGYNWQSAIPGTTGQETCVNVSDNILDVPDEIAKEIFICQTCGKNYKILEPELLFYKKQTIPLPNNCFHCRHLQRRTKRNPRSLWHRQCMCTQIDHHHQGRCSVEFETTYSPDRKEIVYCKDCYQKEIY